MIHDASEIDRSRWVGLGERGFVAAQTRRMYADTLAIDLRPPPNEIFASLHPTGRCHIRAAEKHRVNVRAVTDPSLAPRLARLVRDTMARTRGPNLSWDWEAAIRLTVARPDLAAIFGVFRDDRSGPSSLVAFTFGLCHGDHVEYAAAASSRSPGLKMPLGYAPAWALVKWARSVGATWFDFGGILPAGSDRHHSQAGISRFKNYFGGRRLRVGEEWVFEPARFRTRVANALSALATRFRRGVAARRGPVKQERRIAMTDDQQQLWGIGQRNVPRSDIPAIAHVHYSARIQTVDGEYNPRLQRSHRGVRGPDGLRCYREHVVQSGWQARIVTVPLVANSRFGRARAFRATGRAFRFGVRANY